MEYLNNKKPTRSDKTIEDYMNRAKNLARRFRKAHTIPNRQSVDYRQFVGWLVQNKPNWNKKTWRQYKSAVIAYLETVNDPIAQEAKDTLEHIESNGCLIKSTKTSSTKLKKFPLKDFYKLIEHLETTPYKWSIPLKRWIITGLITGLRPTEWNKAYLDTVENETALIVFNAKNTNGRAHGEKRTILLGMLNEDEIEMIDEHAKKGNEWHNSGQYDEFYRGCSGTLYRACRTLWPNRTKHITLYSTRHQFSADAKASGLSTEEIAALMGHAVDDTATEHYGRKLAGHELLRVRAHAPEVKRVKKMYMKNKKPKQEPRPSIFPTFDDD